MTLLSDTEGEGTFGLANCPRPVETTPPGTYKVDHGVRLYSTLGPGNTGIRMCWFGTPSHLRFFVCSFPVFFVSFVLFVIALLW